MINDGSTSLNKVQQETEPLSLKDPTSPLDFLSAGSSCC